MSQTHIIGAGVAGLTTAVSLVRKGCAVTLYEGSSLAGGRCRSYVDTTLKRKIDNGNHLLLSGNKTALRYLVDIGSADKLIGPDSATFPFFEIGTGRRWCLQPSAGILPWWILDARRRVPDTGAWDYFSALRLAAADVDCTVVDCVGDESLLFRRLWEPLAVAALNTPAQTGSARLLWLVLRDTFAKGETACRPRFARSGLSDAFVDPALKFLRRRGATIRFQHRLRRITYVGGKASRLDFNANKVDLPNHDSVVLALPPAAVARIVPSLKVPEESHTIVNAHFRLSEPAGLPAELPMIGLIGGTAQWLFVRGDVASITVSAADALAAEPADVIARKTWHDVAAALDFGETTLPPYSVIKEKRATFAQTPEGTRRRPGTRTNFNNVYLAGDWIDTGVPATIESAARSGYMAARAVIGSRTATAEGAYKTIK